MPQESIAEEFMFASDQHSVFSSPGLAETLITAALQPVDATDDGFLEDDIDLTAIRLAYTTTGLLIGAVLAVAGVCAWTAHIHPSNSPWAWTSASSYSGEDHSTALTSSGPGSSGSSDPGPSSSSVIYSSSSSSSAPLSTPGFPTAPIPL